MNVTLAETLVTPNRYALVIEDIVVPHDHYQDFKIDLMFNNITNSLFRSFVPEETDTTYMMENRIFHRVNYTFDRAEESGFSMSPDNESEFATYEFSLKSRREIGIDEQIVVKFPIAQRQNQLYLDTTDKEIITLCWGENIGSTFCSYQDNLVKVTHSSTIAKGDVFKVFIRRMNHVAGSSGWVSIWTEKDSVI